MASSRAGARSARSLPGRMRSENTIRKSRHAVWDVHMVRRLVAERGGEQAFVSASPSDGQKAAWGKGSISDWIRESNEIARDPVYTALPAAVSCGRKIAGVVEIDQAYYAKAAPVIEIQIKKAGVRLARVLNETLGR